VNLLVPIDFSGVSDLVISEAKQLACALKAKVWLIHIAEPEPDFVGFEAGPKTVREQMARKYRAEHQKIQSHAGVLHDAGVEAEALLVQGGIIDSILEQAEKLDAAMIVMGSHGHTGLKRVVMGSIAEGVLRRASCAVHIVPARIAA
jgi:nucleotide-binding universal stress UspA family protein